MSNILVGEYPFTKGNPQAYGRDEQCWVNFSGTGHLMADFTTDCVTTGTLSWDGGGFASHPEVYSGTQAESYNNRQNSGELRDG